MRLGIEFVPVVFFGLGDLAKRLGVYDAGEVVQCAEQRLVVAEVAEFSDYVTELFLRFLQGGAALGGDLDADPSPVDFIGDAGESAFLFEPRHDGGERVHAERRSREGLDRR